METTFDTMTLDALRAKYEALAPVMDERVCRLWAAAEAQSLGRVLRSELVDGVVSGLVDGIERGRQRAGVADGCPSGRRA